MWSHVIYKTTLILLVVLLSAGCDRSSEPVDSDGPSTVVGLRPDTRVSDAEINLYEGARKTLIIHSAFLSRFEKIDSTMAYNLNIKILDSVGQVASTIVSDSGIIRETSNQVQMFGDVLVNVGDTTTLASDYLYWNPVTEKIQTEAFVEIVRHGDTLTGYGMEANRDLSRLKILSNVRGSLENSEEIDRELNQTTE